MPSVLRDLSLKARLTAGFAAIHFLFITISVLGVWQVGRIDVALTTVNEIIDRIADMSTQTDSVAAAVSVQTTSTNEIDGSARRAADGTRTVTNGIASIEEAARSSADSCNQLKWAADGLRAQIDGINGAVEGFLREVRAEGGTARQHGADRAESAVRRAA